MKRRPTNRFLPEARVMGAEPAVGLQCPGVGEASAVVSDLGEHSGGELHSQAGEAEQDLSVRVLSKMLLHRPGEPLGSFACGIQLQEKSSELVAHGVFDCLRLAGMVRAEDGLEAVGFGIDAAGASGTFPGSPQLGHGGLCGSGRGRAGGQDGAGLGPGQTVLLGLEGVEGGGVVLAQQRPDLVDQLLAVPHRVLLGAGQDRDRLDQLGVGGQRPVGVHVGAQDVGQYQGIAGVGLLARDSVSVAVSCRRQRVDRVDGPLAGAQGSDQQTPAGLDGHRYRVFGVVAVLGEQIQQELVVGRVVADTAFGQELSGVVDQGHIVMGLGPVDTAEHGHAVLQSFAVRAGGEPVRATRRPNSRTLRSAISLAVRGTSAPQGPPSCAELDGSGRSEEVTLRRAHTTKINDHGMGLSSAAARRHRAPPVSHKASTGRDTTGVCPVPTEPLRTQLSYSPPAR